MLPPPPAAAAAALGGNFGGAAAADAAAVVRLQRGELVNRVRAVSVFGCPTRMPYLHACLHAWPHPHGNGAEVQPQWQSTLATPLTCRPRQQRQGVRLRLRRVTPPVLLLLLRAAAVRGAVALLQVRALGVGQPACAPLGGALLHHQPYQALLPASASRRPPMHAMEDLRGSMRTSHLRQLLPRPPFAIPRTPSAPCLAHATRHHSTQGQSSCCCCWRVQWGGEIGCASLCAAREPPQQQPWAGCYHCSEQRKQRQQGQQPGGSPLQASGG